VEDLPPSEPTEPRPPWLDTPTCKLERAGGVCGGPLTGADHGLTDGELICCACGRKSEATAEEEGQASRADEAWEREQNRAEIREWLTYGDEARRLEVEALTLAALQVDLEDMTHGQIRDIVAVVLSAVGWTTGESALTAGAKLADSKRRGQRINVQLQPTIKAITFKLTIGQNGAVAS